MTARKIISARVALRQPTVVLDYCGGDARPHSRKPPRSASGTDSGIGAIATAVGDVLNSEAVDRRFELRNGWGVTDVRFPVVAWHAS